MDFNGAKVPIPLVGGRGLLKVVALGGAAVIALNSFFNVEDGQYGVVFNHIQGFKEKVYPEGTHLMIPFIERPIIYDAHSQPSWFQRTLACRDLTMVKVGLRVLTRPVPEKLPIICRTFGEDFNAKILPPIVQDSVKGIVARYNADELISQREVITKQIKDMMTLRAGYLDIAVEDVSIMSISIGKELVRGVEAKHVAAKEAESAKFISEKAEVDNRFEITIGQIFLGPELWSKIAKEPTTRSYLDQPDFVQMLRDVQRNPSILKMHLSDARMMQVLNLMLNIKIQWPEASETLPSSQLQQQMMLPEMKSREVEPVPQPEPMDL